MSIEVYLHEQHLTTDRTHCKRMLCFCAPNGKMKEVLEKVETSGFAKNREDSFNEMSSNTRILVKFRKGGSLIGHVGIWTVTICETNAVFLAPDFLTEVILEPQQH